MQKQQKKKKRLRKKNPPRLEKNPEKEEKKKIRTEKNPDQRKERESGDLGRRRPRPRGLDRAPGLATGDPGRALGLARPGSQASPSTQQVLFLGFFFFLISLFSLGGFLC